MKLAINGGDKTRTAPPPAWPVHDQREVERVTAVIQSGHWGRLTGGTAVSELERAFADYQHARHCVALTNGTAALALALRAMDVGAGDEVIVPPLTFIASATSPLMVGALPVFADLDDSCCLSAEAVRAAITPQTRAIIVVHFGGQPADMDALLEVANEHSMPILEDAAHAHGSEWRGKRVGALGAAGAFSFQASKTMTSGEGGAVVTNDERIAELVESYQHIGRVRDRPFYEHHRLAGNERLTEMQAALLSVQLERLDDHIERREHNTRYLNARLAEVDGLEPLPAERDPRVTRRNYFFYLFRYDAAAFGGLDKARFLQALAAEGIPGNAGIPILYHNPLFTEPNLYKHGYPMTGNKVRRVIDYRQTHCPHAEQLCAAYARLGHPLFLGGETDMDQVVDAVEKIRANLGELR